MANEDYYEDEFIINLTIDGTSFEEVEVKVSDPNKTIRDQINSIIQVFELPEMDNGGNPIKYILGQIIEDGEEPEILDFEDEDGREQCLMDYNIQPGDHLYLIPVPIAYACPYPSTMTDMEFHEDDYFINLTIEGTDYEDVSVRVTKPNKAIRDQIESIVRVFELPKMDCGGNPIQYLLGQMTEDSEEPILLDFEDEDGREQCLLDYNVQSGDHLHLLSVPMAGYACPVPTEMEKEWIKYYMCNK